MNQHSTRFGLPHRLALAAVLVAAVSVSPAWAAGEEVTMYKDPNCGCCGKWAEHMRENGFMVKEIATAKMKDLNANDVDAAMRMVEGSARSMGLEVVG